jgi:hypothetical protein
MYVDDERTYEPDKFFMTEDQMLDELHKWPISKRFYSRNRRRCPIAQVGEKVIKSGYYLYVENGCVDVWRKLTEDERYYRPSVSHEIYARYVLPTWARHLIYYVDQYPPDVSVPATQVINLIEEARRRRNQPKKALTLRAFLDFKNKFFAPYRIN